ncbi:MAG TPA: Uma2 family endonuclease [Polyangiaceae bacterium]|nr:Uma2 family endonuclease [Polyangiaceae bacterium]
MGDPAKKRATYQDLMAVPLRFVAEILHGVLHVHRRPAPKHANTAAELGGDVRMRFHRGDGGPGGWWILDEPELHLLVDDVLVPDIAGWRLETMTDLPETAYFPIRPDWVCEVLSPSTAAVDRAEKMPIYADAGVGHAWLVDPILKTLEVFQREGKSWLLLATYKDEAAIRAAPFDAVELDLGALWRPPARSQVR